MRVQGGGLTAEWPDKGGDLVLRVNAEGRERIREILAEGEANGWSGEEEECEALDPLIGNGLNWIFPEQVGALTSAPMLCDGDPGFESDPESGGPGNVWGFMDYQLRSFLTDLAEKGEAVWTWGGEAERKPS